MVEIKNIANLIGYLIILLLLLEFGDEFALAFSIKIEAVLIILLAVKELIFNVIMSVIEKGRVENMLDSLIKEYNLECSQGNTKLIPYEYYFSMIKFARNILYRSTFSEKLIKTISKFESDLMFQKNNAVKTFDQLIKF